jgi:hypothetical protein
MDAVSLWPVFAEHLSLLCRYGRDPRRHSEPSWWGVLSGEEHADLNQGGLTGLATGSDAEALVRFVDAAAVPAVISVASSLDVDVTGVLERAGFVSAPQAEALMVSTRRPVPRADGYRVAPVATREEVIAAMRVTAEGHALPMIDAVYEREPYADRRVTAWLAWVGDEPRSVVWLTRNSGWLGVFAMMTPPAHRGQGAGRAALTSALAASWSDDGSGAFLWSTPMGRPLYESLGFAALDECAIWVRGAGDDAFEALGNV